MLGIAVGIAAVVILTSIGEGLHKFIVAEFTQFGTTLVAINPGKTSTMGMSMGVFGTERPLTIDDAEALRRLSFAKSVVGLIQGNAEVEGNDRTRRTTVYGTGYDFPTAFNMPVRSGQFLPDDDPRAPRALAVLGSKVKDELFGNLNPIGKRIRIDGPRDHQTKLGTPTMGGLLILSALALDIGLARNWFADKTQFGNSILRPIHYPPIGEIEEGLEVIDGFYGAYADRTPPQDSIRLLGNDYLRREYPQLDSIVSTRVTGFWGEPSG